MFANMGSSGGGKGGGKPTGGQGGLWKKGPDGKRIPEAGAQAPKAKDDAKPAEAKPSLQQSLRSAEDKIRAQRLETAHVFDSDGNPLFSNDGGKDYVEFSNAAIAKFKGKNATLTHNHPGGWDFPKDDPRHNGNSFSLEDGVMAAHADLKEIRAVTPTKTYTLKRPPGGWDQQKMERAYADANKQTRTSFYERIRSGKMTIAEAESRHQHEVWQQVAKAIGAPYGDE
jgi:hypothetical protein